MSLCNVLKSYASPQAERNASVHSHSSSSLKMLLSTVRHSGCWHVSHMFNTPVACVFQSECVMASARFILIVRPGGGEGKPRCLPLTPWHWREISVSEPPWVSLSHIPTCTSLFHSFSHSLPPSLERHFCSPGLCQRMGPVSPSCGRLLFALNHQLSSSELVQIEVVPLGH